jgi:BolA protein
VEDESHHHVGHAGHRPGGETHYRVYIVSDAFRGKSRVERHRMVNAALAAELAGGIHALAIHAAAPGEAL